MMKPLRFLVLVLLTLLVYIPDSNAQVGNQEVLMTIAGKNVTVEEFMSIYQKNNMKNQPVDQKALTEYLDLFINFKLKVREAEDLGLDTLSSFRTELSGYRDQLAKPYFMDETTLENMIREAFDRSGQDIRASHIFVRVGPDATPLDTLAAWNKITSIHRRLTEGEKFDLLAMEFSDDPSVRDREANAQHPFIKGNKGDLGYFTVFDMVYPFESAAYNTEENDFSKPVRSEYGYHLVRVAKKQPAMGKVTVAHLYKAIPKNASAQDSLVIRQKIDSIHALLLKGAGWDSLVRIYSDDKASAARGGSLPKFGVNRMVPEFIEAIYQLKNPGDFTKPIMTSYGWHIVRLEERDKVLSFDEVKGELKQKVIKDSRSQVARDVVTRRIMDEYGLKEFPAAKAEFYGVVTDTIFQGKWSTSAAEGLDKPLFRIGDKVTTQNDFAAFLAGKQKKGEKQDIRTYVNKQYKDFLNESLLAVENQNLEKKYPEFTALMHEYRDGILLFDLTDKKVWSKAVKDTTGLKEFYQKNRSDYMWDQRVEGSIYTVKDPQLSSRVRNFISTGLDDDALLKEINGDTLQLLSIRRGKFSAGDHPVIGTIEWKPGLSDEVKTDDGIVFVKITQIIQPQPKELNEARGLITADYQNFLEAQWIKELKKKYPVTVSKEVFAKIK